MLGVFLSLWRKKRNLLLRKESLRLERKGLTLQAWGPEFRFPAHQGHIPVGSNKTDPGSQSLTVTDVPPYWKILIRRGSMHMWEQEYWVL